MVFQKKLLNDGEDVILDLEPHWSTLAKPVAVLVVVLAATIVAFVLNSLAGLIVGVVLVLTAAWVGQRIIRRRNINFVLTTDRLVYRSGIVSKHGKEIPLERVNDIAFHQSVFERLIGT